MCDYSTAESLYNFQAENAFSGKVTSTNNGHENNNNSRRENDDI